MTPIKHAVEAYFTIARKQKHQNKMTPIKTTQQAHYSYEDGITINFIDGKFASCTFAFRGTYTRAQWNKLAEIEAEISRLERSELASSGVDQLSDSFPAIILN